MLKHLVSFFICLFVIFSVSRFAFADNYAIIINQVRGEECCGAGSLDNLKLQLDTSTKLKLRASYALRYDVLNDKRYIDVLLDYKTKFPDLVETAGMIEIIPSLAASAGVQYKGNNENWFHAQYALTVGYENPNRFKLIDAYMTKYKDIFGDYPKLTSAWIIDTESANYLHDKYHVLSHQLTREQWGTDSYTLYGGPFHYPYKASRNWIFVPNSAEQNSLLVLRQTVTDPLYNYGDTDSRFTSQPNDYARDGKNIEYFKNLITNAFNQPSGQTGFILLGLENSMNNLYQEDYIRQLTWLSENMTNYHVQNVFGDSSKLNDEFANKKISVYYGKNDKNEAWNVTTDNYRIRIIHKSDSIYITDMRIYTDDMTDPYKDKVAKMEAFWITPFALDGSRWYKPKDAFSGPHAFIPVTNDFGSMPSGIKIRNANGEIITTLNQTGLTLKQLSGDLLIQSEPSSIKTTKNFSFENYLPVDNPITFSEDKKSSRFTILHLINKMVKLRAAFNIEINCASGVCIFQIPEKIAYYKNLYSEFYPYYFPESVGRKLSDKYSKVTVHNTFAIADRNPVRIILEPHDDFNFPILLSHDAQIKVKEENIYIKTLGNLKSSKYQYVDFYSDKPKSSDVEVKMSEGGGEYDKIIRIFFAPNCKIDRNYCITHPLEAVWYLIAKVSDWWSGRK
ncbi:MAG: hypothetical protein U0525_02465 [Patescibacteria group bacterium]